MGLRPRRRVPGGLGELDAADLDLTGAGEAVARQAEYFGLDDLAAQARDLRPLEFADDIAVVTGASPNSIAASVVKQLLRGGQRWWSPHRR